ncbi:seleno protein W, 1 [Hyaloraphidium curvatum]|nr:seleno protein W, 1 [Hyaloraphidium curvatum]
MSSSSKVTVHTRELKAEFGSKISITSFSTPTATSKFEVTVGGVLVHSKIGGAGFVDNESKLQRIFAAIEAELAKDNSS